MFKQLSRVCVLLACAAQAAFTGTILLSGGTVLVQNPGFGSQALSEYPDTTGLSILFQTGDTVHILLPGNPLNAGLTDAGLSGWNNSTYGIFTAVPGGYT